MKTTRGIYLDLEESDYTYKVDNFRFYFSSAFYRDKFIEKYQEIIKYEKIKFENMYKVKLDNTFIFLFCLYSKIEKRGYYIYDTETKKCYDRSPIVEINLL